MCQLPCLSIRHAECRRLATFDSPHVIQSAASSDATLRTFIRVKGIAQQSVT